jgi:DNA polymerase (family 10)
MPPLDAQAIAALLRELAQRSAAGGGNPYRSKAYRRAAESVATLPIPLEQLVAERRLREIPGVGEGIAEIIATLHKTGSHPTLEALRQEGGARLRDTTDDSGGGQRHIDRAAMLLDNAVRTLREARPELKRITAAGDFRRGAELVGDLALVAEAPSLADGPSTLTAGGELTVHLTDAAHYGITLLHATGSKSHLQALTALARDHGLTLDKRGLRQGRKPLAAASEEAIYQRLGLPFIQPELREGRDEIARALANDLPELVTEQDLRGILHAHTDQSDGVDTLEAMAEATRARGYSYLGVADHSISARYAGGLTAPEIEAQHRLIARLNKRYGKGFRILKGIESDILADGSLDYPDEVLQRFDFVVASVHSRFKLDREAQTRRIIRAVGNRRTTILGHMTGRRLLQRPGYAVDVEAILKACAAHGVAVEINAHPWRLDLDWRWHQRALELGCLLSINPDAHSTRELDFTRWGVTVARKGGVPAERVLNCRNLAQLVRYLGRRQKRIANSE